MHVAGGRFGDGHVLQQAPEEAHVEVAQRVVHREVMKLGGGELLERIIARDGATVTVTAR